MKSDAAPPMDDDVTDAGPPQRKTSLRALQRGRSFVETRRRVGNYRVIALLGEGGMAQVHLAVKHGPSGFKKLLVVKSMRDELVDPIHAKSFMHEARLAAQLNHPNVIQTYEVGEDEGHLFIAMEYVEGQSMRAVQRRLAPKTLPLHVQLRILAELGKALHHAHTLTAFDGTPLQVVHRDISPQNVMLTYDGQVKLLDFGIAKAQGSDELTREGMIKGKIDYMAPEQLRGDAIDQRADVFALGVMLWEALTGMRFSGGAEVAEITKMHNRIMGREQKLRNVAPSTPMRLVEICEHAIALDPKERLSSADAFESAITSYLAETSSPTGANELSQIMEGLFASDRKKMRKLLEEQLRNIGTTDSTEEEIEVIVVENELDPNLTPSQISVMQRTGNAAAAERSNVSRRTLAMAGLVTVFVAAGVGTAASFFSTAQSESPRTAVSPAGLVLPSASGPSVLIQIDATPSTASARLDGATISLPFAARMSMDHRLHRLEVHAPGYASVTRSISTDRDADLEITLVRQEDEVSASHTDTRRVAVRAPTARAPSSPQSVTIVQPTPAPTPSPTPAPSPPTARATPPSAEHDMQATPVRRPVVIESSNPYDE